MRGAVLAVWMVAGLASHGWSLAQESGDMDALALADRTPSQQSQPSQQKGLRLFGEVGAVAGRGDGGEGSGAIFAASLIWEHPLSSDVQLVFSNRYDSYLNVFPSRSSHDVNTVREAYLDLRLAPWSSVQAGRVNVRQGVGRGYNPSDYFRDRAVRSFVSADPDSLRANRQGVVVVAPQAVWASGSSTLFIAPKLANRTNSETFAFDAGATNNRNRGLLTVSQRLTDDIRPQFSLMAEDGRSPQWGANLTGLVGDKTVLYAEWSGGTGRSMIARSLNRPESTRLVQRAAIGGTYTTDSKLSLTAEYDYNGAGAGADDWLKLKALGPQAVGKVLLDALDESELPSRRNWFFHALWKDMGIDGLDAAGFLRLSRADGSRQYWGELRYRIAPRHEVYLQEQRNVGQLGSVYGSAPVASSTSLFYRHYFF